jgi:hypothetical protein
MTRKVINEKRRLQAPGVETIGLRLSSMRGEGPSWHVAARRHWNRRYNVSHTTIPACRKCMYTPFFCLVFDGISPKPFRPRVSIPHAKAPMPDLAYWYVVVNNRAQFGSRTLIVVLKP